MVRLAATHIAEFLDPSGVTTDLTSLPGVITLGSTGLEMPPFDRIEEDTPAGVRLQTVRARPRDVNLQVYVEQANQLSLRTFLRSMAAKMNPLRGDGTLRSYLSDGTSRDLICRYTDGLAGQRVIGQSGANYRLAVLTFRAFDPFWYDTMPQSLSYGTGAQPVFLGNPFLGLALASDNVIGTSTITNGGDVEAWPVWTVNGPVTGIKLTNTTTGEVIDLPVTLAAGQSVVIDTRPFKKTIRREDGTNLYGTLVTTSTLWSLRTGMTSILIELPGATGATYATLNYQRRYLTA